MASIFTGRDEAVIRRATGLNSKVAIQIPENHFPNRFVQGWETLHAYPFSLGFRLPFPLLVMSVLQTFELAPSQLHPQIWKILYLFFYLSKAFSIDVDVGVVMSKYTIGALDNVIIRLGKKPGVHPFLLDINTDVDHDWDRKFFMINIESACRVYGDVTYLGVPWCVDVSVLSKDIPNDNSDQILSQLVQRRCLSEDGTVYLQDEDDGQSSR